MGSVKRAMELDCLPMNAKSSPIDYHSSGYFLSIVRITFMWYALLSNQSVVFSGCADSPPCCHCKARCSPSHHLEGVHLLHPDLTHCC